MRSFVSLAVVCLFMGHAIEETKGFAVMSVDLGNEYAKIAIVKPGVPMEIVLNKESQRKTPTVVFLGPDERIFADSANSKGVRKPTQRFAHLLDVLGKNMSHPAVQRYKEAFPFYDLEEDPLTGTVVFRTISYQDGVEEVIKFRPEELLAMVLEYARKNVEDFSEQRVKSGIITVPAHFGQLERVAVLRAADLAGIEVLQLMNDYAAAALQYALVRLQTFSDTPSYFVLFDLGSTHSTASVISFEKAKSKEDGEIVEHVVVRGVAYSRELSTTAVHNAVRSHLLHQYESNPKLKDAPNIRKNPKAMSKMFKEAIRVVHILSANTAVGSYIESIVGEIDFQGHITRAELEDACNDIFQLIPVLIKEALQRANLGPDLISEIVLMGAGTRIPKVQEILKTALEGRTLSDLGRGLNTDEASALGAVYQAAHLSKGFKVKRIVLRDAVTFPISVEFNRIIDEAKKDQEAGVVRRMLFDLASPFPQKKLITFGKHTTDFTFNVSFSGRVDPTWVVKVENVKEAFEKHADKVPKGVKAHFAMDDSGILHLRTMEAIFEAEENETVVEEKGIFSKFGDKLKGFFSSDDNSTNSTSGSETEGTATPTPDEETNSTSTESPSVADNTTTEGSVVVKTKTITYRENLTFSVELLDTKAFPDEEMTKSRNVIKEYHDKDELRLKTAKARNDVEASVIDIKDKLENEHTKKFLKEDEWDTIFAKAKEIGDWLDEEAGPRTPLSEYVERQTEVRNTVKTWFERLHQAKERPKAIAYIVQTLNSSEYLLKAFLNLNENISAESGDTLFSEVELNALERQINETYTWLGMMLEAQNATADNEDAKLKVEDVKEKAAILEREVRYLTNKAKAYRPKPKPKPKPKDKTENDSITIEDTTPESQGKSTVSDGEEAKENAETTEQPTTKTIEEDGATDSNVPPSEGEEMDPTHSPQDL